MSTPSITLTAGNLFQLAAQLYGDATLWWLLASANGLTDPFITALIVLKIPPLNKSYIGGVPQ